MQAIDANASLTSEGKAKEQDRAYQDYAQKRLHWKPRHPLSVILLRVYRLEEPRMLPYLERYSGCKSWVELAEEVSLGQLTPTLTQEEFNTRVTGVKGAMEVQSSRL